MRRVRRYLLLVCRNIKILYNFDPPATDQEILAAAEQFVRKVTGFHMPSKVNAVPFDRAVLEVSRATRKLLDSLVTGAEPRNRDVEAARARERARVRFGPRAAQHEHGAGARTAHDEPPAQRRGPPAAPRLRGSSGPPHPR